MTTVEARKRLAELINRAAYGGESVLVTRRGQELAAIVPASDATLADRLRGFLSRQEVSRALDELDTDEAAAWHALKRELGL